MRTQFQTPDADYRGLDLWMLNGKLTDEELRFQIHEMKSKGFHTVIARTYNGLDSDYPGSDFMQKMRTIIETAKEVGMRIVLQAGYMPAAVRRLPKEYALGYIDEVPCRELTGEEKILCEHNGMAYVERTRDIVINMFDEEAVKYYVNRCYGEMWKEFVDEFGKTIYSVWVDEPRFPPSHIPWSPRFEEQYREKWGCELLPDLYQLFVNEGNYKELRCRFRLLMQEKMAAAYYTQIRGWCNKNGLKMSGHLMGEETTCHQMEDAVCIMPYYKYFDIPGIDFLACMLNWSYDGTEGEYYDINRYYSTPIQCLSAAHQAGKEQLLCEMYGVTAPNLTFRSQKNIFDHFAAFGFNIRCCHALFYSTAGFRKRFYPHQVHYYEPYWEKYGRMNDYCARVGQFISFGKPQGGILILHPMETAFMLHEGGEQKEGNQILKAFDRRMTQLQQEIFGEGLSYEYGDLMSIRESGKIAENGTFQIGQMQYHTVVLPRLETLNRETFELLCQFRAQGGRVIVLETVPDRIDGSVNEEVRRTMSQFEFARDNGELIRRLKKLEKEYELTTEQTSPGFIVNYRKDENNRYFMIHNFECNRATRTKLCIKGTYDVFCWNAADGSVEKADFVIEQAADGEMTTAYFTVPEGGSILLTFEKPKDTAVQPIAWDSVQKACMKESVLVENIDGGWLAERDDHKNLLMLDFCRVRREGETKFSKPIPAVGINDWLNKLVSPAYSGMIELAFEFTAEDEMEEMQLIIERPDVQEIRLNGELVDSTPVGTFYSHDFKIVQLPGKIQKGQNVITLKRQFIPESKAPSHHLLELFIDGKGSEIESIYLYGDFKVDFHKEQSHSSYLQTGPYFAIAKEAPQVVVDSSYGDAGYPFYIGDLILRKEIEITDNLENYKSVRLSVGEFHACVGEVFVNGEPCEELLWEPFETELLPCLKPGKNQIELRLKTTLRNMIGPHHYKQHVRPYECGHVSTIYWKSVEPDWMLETNAEYKRWNESYLFCDYGVYRVELHKSLK